MRDIGQILRTLRGPLTQEAAAHKSGITMNAWYCLEAGRNAPKVVTLDKIAAAFGTTTSELLEEKPAKVKA